MAYAVVRTDNMYGTDVRAALVSVEYIVTTGEGASTVKTPTAIENGHVLKLGGLMDGEREIFEGSDVATNTPRDEVVLVCSPEVLYDQYKHNLDEFINVAGAPCRGYRFHTGDIFSVTKDALDGKAEPAVGDAVELKAGTKMNVVASPTASTTQIGKIIAVDNAGRYTYYAIQVA